VGVLVLVIVAGVALTARRAGGNGGDKKKKSDEGPVASPVELTTARRGRIATFAQNTTTLEARNAAVLVARRPGQVLALLAEEGQWLKKGQPLARLDDREARLKVQRTELAAEVAKREIDRAKQLSDKGYMSAREIDDLEVKRRNAWVELEQARYELSQMVITAPFAGRVVDRMVQLGETVTEGKECFRIVDFDPVLARLYFPERELPRIRVGQDAVVTMDANPGHEFHGRVALVNPVVDRTNGTFKVTLEIANPNGALRPGTFARARIKTGEFEGAVLMPRRGLITEDGEDYVFVARGDSVVRIGVNVGAIEGDDAQILAGLREGDSVVTVGHGGLKPGAKIKPVTL
jgi:RND family efflux transporter MFP subunit